MDMDSKVGGSSNGYLEVTFHLCLLRKQHSTKRKERVKKRKSVRSMAGLHGESQIKNANTIIRKTYNVVFDGRNAVSDGKFMQKYLY